MVLLNRFAGNLFKYQEYTVEEKLYEAFIHMMKDKEIKAIEAVEPTKVVGISINLKNAELDLDTEYFEHKYDLPVEDVYNNGASKLLDAIFDYLGE